MDYRQKYKEKLITAAEAAGKIKSGDWVDYGWSVTNSVAVDQELAKRVGDLQDVNIRGGLAFRKPAIFDADPEGISFTWNSWHAGAVERKVINLDGNQGFFAPLRYSEIPKWYREGNAEVNVAIVSAAPMDKHGFFNFGISASHQMAVIESADMVIVEVNDKIPYCYGRMESEIHIDQVDYIVESDNLPLPTLADPTFTDLDKKVAEYIVNEIPNGATLQLGIGGMPNAVGAMIADSDLKDLGVHTEMYVDSFIDMTLKGKVTGAKKNVDRFRQVYGFAAGSQRMYDFMDHNPQLMAAPVDYTNAAATCALFDNFISINSAVNVDIFGQVSSESAGRKHISGAGGQLDFALGAYLSKGGKSFIALSSTYKDKDGKTQSRIVPDFETGSIITMARPNTNYIVTEYGLFNAKGKTTWQRAEGIINLAHPDFRDELIKKAEEVKIWRRSNKR